MFTQHPLRSEFFDSDFFIEENLTSLYDLYQQAIAVVEDKFDVEDEGEFYEMVACLLASAVYADVETIELPLDIQVDIEDPGLQELSQDLHSIVICFQLEDKGLIERKGNRFLITELGKTQFTSIIKDAINDEVEVSHEHQ